MGWLCAIASTDGVAMCYIASTDGVAMCYIHCKNRGVKITPWCHSDGCRDYTSV